MLQISTPENKRIPYHDKVIYKYNKTINSIAPRLIEFNPILSGSFAMNLVFSPDSVASDFDLYFSNLQDYENAIEYLTSIYEKNFPSTEIITTENATTFIEWSLQLIKKKFFPPEELIYDHDFINVSVAITSDSIYTTKETFLAWKDNQLSLRSFQLDEESKKDRYFVLAKIQDTCMRILKYSNRYSLDVSFQTQEYLLAAVNYIIENFSNELFQDGRPAIINFPDSYPKVLNYSGKEISKIICFNSLFLNFEPIITDSALSTAFKQINPYKDYFDSLRKPHKRQFPF